MSVIELASALMIWLAAASPVDVQNVSARHPSEWADEERIAMRVDAARARDRVAEASGGNAIPWSVRSEAMPAVGDVIDGHRHPELFMPTELFRGLLTGAFAEDLAGRAAYRAARFAAVDRDGLPADFFEQLEPIARSYVEVAHAARVSATDVAKAPPSQRASAEAQLGLLQAGQCARLTTALAKARALFGRAKLDRFLYDAVAPSFLIASPGPESRSQLIAAERGCGQ